MGINLIIPGGLFILDENGQATFELNGDRFHIERIDNKLVLTVKIKNYEVKPGTFNKKLGLMKMTNYKYITSFPIETNHEEIKNYLNKLVIENVMNN